MKSIQQTECPNCWGYQTYEYQSEEKDICESNPI